MGTATIWAPYTEAAEIGPVDSRMKAPRTVRTAICQPAQSAFVNLMLSCAYQHVCE